MAAGTTARKPQGLQVSFLEYQHDVQDITVNGTQKLWGTLPKGASITAIHTNRREAPTGGARQVWVGTLSDKTALVNTAGFQEGTSTVTDMTRKAFAFTEDTDIYIAQTGMTTTLPTAGIWDFAMAYVVSPLFEDAV